MIGSRHWSDRTKIKDTILALKKRFIEDLTIISGGNSYGADPLVRKYALEMDCKYKEFNVSHTTKNLYSVLPEAFFGKPYSAKNFFVRNNIMIRYSDCIMAFIPKNKEARGTINIIKCAKKMGKKIVIIE